MALPQELSPTVRRYGSDEPLPEQIPLRAGPISLVFEAGCLRRIRVGEHELLRRVYVAIRDQAWGTAPDEISNLHIDAVDDSFYVTFDVRNRLGDVDFTWRGEIRGDADGTIRFSMDGEALADFLRARIGFCALPPMTVAGQPARITHVDGTVDEAPFPESIAPQLVIDGTIKPVAPFEEMASLTYEAAPGLWAHIAFEGDIFEMEDQRNWTDASYKIYSTPLRIPWPAQVRRGDRVQQSVTLRLQGNVPQASTDESAPVITVSNKAVDILPELGLGMASHGEPLSAQEIERLRALKLAHLRVDLDLTSPHYAGRLRQACAEAAAIGAALEVALFVDPDGLGEVQALLSLLRELQPAIARWLVFDRSGMSNAELVEEARPDLYRYDAHAYVGGGTNGYFTDLNRERPDAAHMDLLAYSVNPQVHAFDNDSLMETPAAQAATVHSATRLARGKPVVVSPVTLRPRFNPHAADREGTHDDELPPQVDVRQLSLFTAAWTVASLKHLAESVAEAVTYFETTGWRGVMETEAGSPMPGKFPSTPGGVYPVYHVLADAGEFAGGEVLTVAPLQTPYVEALAMRREDRVRVLVANLRPHAQEVELRGLPVRVALSVLDEETYAQAVGEPDVFRAQPPQYVDTNGGSLAWKLPPYAVLRVDY